MPSTTADRPGGGTMRLPVIVLGAAEGVGPGVVQALLEAGHPVVAVDQECGPLETLGRALQSPGLTLLPGAVDSESAGAALAEAVRQLRRLPGAVVASLGGEFERGRLLDHPGDRLRDKLEADLLPHLVAARHLLPLLADGERRGTYLLIGGPGADNPWAGYGHLSVASAALRMLVRVLHEEMLDASVRVQQLAVPSPVRTDSNRDCACPHWPSALDVGRQVVELLRGAHGADAVVRFDPQLAQRARLVVVSNPDSSERLSDVHNRSNTIGQTPAHRLDEEAS